MTGLRPIVEIGFEDFLTACMDPLVNQAAKLRYMLGGQVKIPLVVYTFGGGGLNAGPQHSQSFASWFSQVPGLKAVMPATPNDVYDSMRAAVRDDNPVLLLLSKKLISTVGDLGNPKATEILRPIDRSYVLSKGADVTVVAFGAMLQVASKAKSDLLDLGYEIEIINGFSVNPFDIDTIIASVKKTGRLIVVHEAHLPCGPGAEIFASIVEIDNLRNWNFKGNYSQYLKQKENFLAALDDRIKTVEKKISHTQSALRSMKSANKYDKSISAKHKMIERMQQELKALKARKPKQRKGLRFNLEAADKSSNDIIELKDVSKRFDGLQRPILDKQNLEISKGDRIGIVGGNGQGKTTLLKVITGDEEIDSGDRDLAPGAIIGYYHQDHRTLDFKLDPVKQVEVLRPDMQYGDIRAALGRFQFTKEQVSTPLGKLSGGERARVALLKLLLEENNLLLLDEPTNHLDMDAKETLEEALVEYDGAIVTVSHDRWFLDQVVNQIWELQDGIVTKYYGNYTDYIRKKKGLPPLVDGEEPVL